MSLLPPGAALLDRQPPHFSTAVYTCKRRSLNDEDVTYHAYLQPNELQDLADDLRAIMELQAKYGMKIRFNLAVEVTAEEDLKPEATAELRKGLDDISDAWH